MRAVNRYRREIITSGTHPGKDTAPPTLPPEGKLPNIVSQLITELLIAFNPKKKRENPARIGCLRSGSLRHPSARPTGSPPPESARSTASRASASSRTCGTRASRCKARAGLDRCESSTRGSRGTSLDLLGHCGSELETTEDSSSRAHSTKEGSGRQEPPELGSSYRIASGARNRSMWRLPSSRRSSRVLIFALPGDLPKSSSSTPVFVRSPPTGGPVGTCHPIPTRT